VLGCVGCAFSDIGFHEKGIPIIEKAIEIDATNAQAFAALGAAKIVTLDIENGVKDLEHAIKLSPVNAGSALWKATLSIGQTVLGNHSAAYEMALQACKDDPRYYPAYIAMALAHVQQGRVAEAQKAMDEAQHILPDLDRTKVRNFLGAWAEQTLTEAGVKIPEQQPG
jgi:tetratricopeptide (TPR) repeat protein